MGVKFQVRRVTALGVCDEGGLFQEWIEARIVEGLDGCREECECW